MMKRPRPDAMDYLLTLALACALLSQVNPLTCFECDGTSCSNPVNVTCPAKLPKCESYTSVYFTEKQDVEYLEERRGCSDGTKCFIGYLNVKGKRRRSVNTHCCDTDHCNNPQAPALNATSPNGLKCFYCDEENCTQTVECRGPEDRCISIIKDIGFSSLKATWRGCASQRFCCEYSLLFQHEDYTVNCCKENMCNGALTLGQKSEGVTCSRALRVTQSIIFLILLPLTSFILFG